MCMCVVQLYSLVLFKLLLLSVFSVLGICNNDHLLECQYNLLLHHSCAYDTAEMQSSRAYLLATPCRWQWKSWTPSLRVRLGTPTSWWQGVISLGGWRLILFPTRKLHLLPRSWWTACSADFRLQSKSTSTKAGRQSTRGMQKAAHQKALLC